MAEQRTIDDLEIIERGLPADAGKRQRVVVVGAGMAGLVAAYELVRVGHDVVVLEAQGWSEGSSNIPCQEAQT